jgi:transposase, IS5 family
MKRVVKLRDVEALLLENYDTGTSNEGADAYPALVLLKAFLLQKWFRIPSDPELEIQVNDRISFKKFLGLPLDRPSPDYSRFSRFRNRSSEEAIREHAQKGRYRRCVHKLTLFINRCMLL